MSDFEESTHENSKHHADVVEYEEDTNPGGWSGYYSSLT